MTMVLYDVPGPKARRRQLVGSAVGTVVVLGVLAAVVAQLTAKGQFAGAKWDMFADPRYIQGFGRALWATVRAALCAIVLALLFGVVFCSGRLSERWYLRGPSVVVIEFFRAVPLLLLILFLFLGFGKDFQTWGQDLSGTMPDQVATFLGVDQLGTMGPLVLALMLYNGSVLAEVFRSGITAIPRGQSEAAYALGLRKSQVMRLVLVPQAVRIMLPAIISQCVVALKDTALGFAIGYTELIRYGQTVYNARFNIIPTAIVVAVIYIAVNMSLSRLAVWLERRQSRRFGREAVRAVEAAAGTPEAGAGPAVT